MNVEQALEIKAEKNAAKIAAKYEGNKEVYKKKLLEGSMMSIGSVWEKDGYKRIYFNNYGVYYDFETESFIEEKFYVEQKTDFDGFYKRLVSEILD